MFQTNNSKQPLLVNYEPESEYSFVFRYSLVQVVKKVGVQMHLRIVAVFSGNQKLQNPTWYLAVMFPAALFGSCCQDI